MTDQPITTPVNLRMPIKLFERVESLRNINDLDRRKTKTDTILDLVDLGLSVLDRYKQMVSPEAIQLLNEKMDSTEIVDILERLDERTFRALVAAVGDAKLIREARQRRAVRVIEK